MARTRAQQALERASQKATTRSFSKKTKKAPNTQNRRRSKRFETAIKPNYSETKRRQKRQQYPMVQIPPRKYGYHLSRPRTEHGVKYWLVKRRKPKQDRKPARRDDHESPKSLGFFSNARLIGTKRRSAFDWKSFEEELDEEEQCAAGKAALDLRDTRVR